MSRHLRMRPETRNAPPIVHDVLQTPGSPLDPGTRATLEARLGIHAPRLHDLAHPQGKEEANRTTDQTTHSTAASSPPGFNFANVRIHTGARAAESADAVNALAYTVGQDIVFGAGQYAPRSHAGQELLTHELTHVVQQTRGGASPHRPASAIALDESGEGEAARTANRELGNAPALRAAPVALARQAKPAAKAEKKGPSHHALGIEVILDWQVAYATMDTNEQYTYDVNLAKLSVGKHKGKDDGTVPLLDETPIDWLLQLTPGGLFAGPDFYTLTYPKTFNVVVYETMDDYMDRSGTMSIFDSPVPQAMPSKPELPKKPTVSMIFPFQPEAGLFTFQNAPIMA